MNDKERIRHYFYHVFDDEQRLRETWKPRPKPKPSMANVMAQAFKSHKRFVLELPRLRTDREERSRFRLALVS